MLASIGETESRLAPIESRKKLVDEVQLKTNVIVNMLEDVAPEHGGARRAQGASWIT